MSGWRYNAVGLGLRSEFSLLGMPPVDDLTAPIVSIRLSTRGELEQTWPGTVEQITGTLPDGCSFRGELGSDGTRRFTYGERATYVLSADARTILCAPADFDEPSWQRFLLDSVLLKASDAHGFEALHASAVEGPAGVLAFAAGSGGGKSSIAAELARRGHRFFADDVLALARVDGQVHAYISPPLMNLPLAGAETPPPAQIGVALAAFDDEAWVAVRAHATEPRPVARIYLLARQAGLGLGLDLLQPSPMHLIPHVLTGGGPDERMTSRFELLGDLAAQSPIYRLSAPLEVGVAQLVDLVEEEMAPAEGSAEVGHGLISG
ncbi:MAG: hypothetical protein M3375_00165 [Actinomycetota bacterium]|nr:hypothetical protein [Actinomycetota bacterium]